MERTKNILTAIIIVSCMAFGINKLSAQKRYSTEIYQAYIDGDIRKWEQVIAALETSGTPTLAGKLELAEYYYAHIGYLLGAGQKNVAKTYIGKGEKLVDDILKTSPSNATATSQKGIFVAYRMEMNKLKAPVLGPQCMRLIKRAYELDPKNIQAVSDLGNMYYHCPVVFGGDKKLGIKYISEAIKMMEQRSLDSQNWFYLNLLAMLAQYEAESGKKTQAKATYQKILNKEPRFKWVRDELYPNLLKSM